MPVLVAVLLVICWVGALLRSMSSSDGCSFRSLRYSCWMVRFLFRIVRGVLGLVYFCVVCGLVINVYFPFVCFSSLKRCRNIIEYFALCEYVASSLRGKDMREPWDRQEKQLIRQREKSGDCGGEAREKRTGQKERKREERIIRREERKENRETRK